VLLGDPAMTTTRVGVSSAVRAILLTTLASSCSEPEASSDAVGLTKNALHDPSVALCEPTAIEATAGFPRYNQYTNRDDYYADTDKTDFLLNLRPRMRLAPPYERPFSNTEIVIGVQGGWTRGPSNQGHGGIDYYKATATPHVWASFKARAVAPGRVISVATEPIPGAPLDDTVPGDGNNVTVEHTAPDGTRYRSIYVHLRDGAVHDCNQAKSVATGNYKMFMDNQNCDPGQVDTSIWGPEDSSIAVTVGQMVTAGQIIGDAGQTGFGAIANTIDANGHMSGNLIHLHLYFATYAAPEARPTGWQNTVTPTDAEWWVLVDPYGVYGYAQQDQEGHSDPDCYAARANTAGYRLFGPTRRNDRDGDDQTDFMFVRPGSDGTAGWSVLNRRGWTNNPVQFGLNTDIPTPGDYDGDGRTDFARYRPGTQEWFVALSSGGSIPPTVFGDPSDDVPVPGDYDGDGKTDLAVFRTSTGVWRVKLSGGGQDIYKQYGGVEDKPVPADYDGDGKTDIALYRTFEQWSGIQGKWYIIYSSTDTELSPTPVYGFSDDTPVPADYDGDGRADIAIYRPFESWSGVQGKWYIIYSSTGNELSPTPVYGYWNDRPVPGDYDGDGRTDIAIFSGPRNGTWYVLPSTGGEIVEQWGADTDLTP
jgi:murein DD-endopeptidase MepM/ murein hydrolase activator NlpD